MPHESTRQEPTLLSHIYVIISVYIGLKSQIFLWLHGYNSVEASLRSVLLFQFPVRTANQVLLFLLRSIGKEQSVMSMTCTLGTAHHLSEWRKCKLGKWNILGAFNPFIFIICRTYWGEQRRWTYLTEIQDSPISKQIQLFQVSRKA